MKRIYHPYWIWEDYKNGLYSSTSYTEKKQEELSKQAKEFLSDSELFLNIGLQVINKWKYASEVNLSNKARNRQAWIGQASVCFYYGIPEYITKFGWRLMDLDSQERANEVADVIISQWEVDHAKKI